MIETGQIPGGTDVEQSGDQSAPGLAKRISGWTNNLLAAAIVLMLSLVVGRQLVYLWVGDREETSSAEVSTDVIDVWPALTAASLEFGDVPFRMVRDQIDTDKPVMGILRERCRRLLDTAMIPVHQPGKAETRLLQKAEHWNPVDQEVGKWRLFHGIDEPQPTETGLPVVIGIRDDCPGANPSRLVVFGLAMPRSSESSTIFVFQSMGGEDPKVFTVPIPDSSQRTLAISADQQGQLIGFRGGTPKETMAFYDRWSSKSNWRGTGAWTEAGSSWCRRFVPRDKNKVTAGIGVDLSLDEHGILRGFLVVDSVGPQIN